MVFSSVETLVSATGASFGVAEGSVCYIKWSSSMGFNIWIIQMFLQWDVLKQVIPAWILKKLDKLQTDTCITFLIL